VPGVSLSEGNNGETVAVRRGDTLDLRLSENPSTGFRWKVVRADRLSEEEPAPDSTEVPARDSQSQVGRGGLRVFRFRAIAPGDGRLELKLWREFEGDASVLRRFAIGLTVAD
jgi:inhibitor of cysteine peptidase